MRSLDSLSAKDSPLLAVAARRAGRQPDAGLGVVNRRRRCPLPPYRAADGAVYFVTFSPLDFLDWKIVTVIPEKDFLANIDRNTQRLLWLLAGFTLAMILAAILLADWLIGRPLIRIARELRHIEGFRLDRISRVASPLRELDDLSARDDADGPGPDLLPEIPADGAGAHPGLPGHRGQARRPAADPDRALRRSRRLHLALGAAGGGGRAGADPLSQRRLGCDRAGERHHRQIHRRCGDGLLGRAQDRRASRRSRLPRRARLPRGPGPDPRAGGRKAGPARCICASASIPAPCWWAISGRKSGSTIP